MMDPRPALSLSCREADPAYDAPPIAPFLVDARGAHPEGEALMYALLISARGEPGRAVTRSARAPLPAPVATTGIADLSQWSITYLWRQLQKGSPIARALAGIAVAAPLALSPAQVFAGEPQPGVSIDADAADAEAAALEAAARAATERAAEEAARANDLSFTGTRLWDSVRGARILLTLTDEAIVLGRLLTQTVDEIALILQQDGLVLRIPKENVLGMKVQALPDELSFEWQERTQLRELQREDKRPARGEPLAVVGVGLTIAGGAILTGLLVAAAISSSTVYYGFPAIFISTNLLGVGIPFLGAGARLERDYKDWERRKREQRLSIGLGPTKDGWAGALSVRF